MRERLNLHPEQQRSCAEKLMLLSLELGTAAHSEDLLGFAALLEERNSTLAMLEEVEISPEILPLLHKSSQVTDSTIQQLLGAKAKVAQELRTIVNGQKAVRRYLQN